MRYFIVSFLCVLALGPLAGQEKKTAKSQPLAATYLRDHAQTRGFLLGRPLRPMPTPDGSAVLFLRSPPRSSRLSLFEYDVATGMTRELLTPEKLLKGAEEKLSPEEKARRERMRLAAGGIASFHLSPDGKSILIPLAGNLYVVDRQTLNSRELLTSAGFVLDPQFSPDGTKVSFVRDHDVYVFDLAANKEQRITTGGSEALSHGLAEFIAQEEMGRFSGYWWSPDSRAIVYQESDAKDVEVWHVADPARPEQKPQPFFYPRPGKDNVKVQLGIRALAGGATTWIRWDRDKYPYLATVRWAAGGPPCLCVQIRDQSELVLLQVDAKSGETTPLATERDPTWVNIHQDVPRWLDDGSGFLWISERDGGPQLEWRATNGRLKRVLCPADQGFQSLLHVNGKQGYVVYTASTDPTQAHVYRLALTESSEPESLTDEKGLHTAVFPSSHSIFVLSSRTLREMPRVTVHRSDGAFVDQLPSAAEEPGFQPQVEMLKVGKREYHAVVVRPHDFDAGKKYPVLVDVYGGPHHLHVAASKQRWLLDQWYADQGFIVVALDGRGTPGRGRDWERAIFQKFGSLPLEDQVAGLQSLFEQVPAMDRQRVGIMGWSFGGYMSALAVLRRPDVFHAASAGAPVADWGDYDTHYTERYLGIPPKDDAAYHEGSLLTYAKDLKRPLLILHGTADDNVYFRHSLRLADALFRSGKEFEMVPLTGLTHMVPDPAVMQSLHGRIAEFFRKHLTPRL